MGLGVGLRGQNVGLWGCGVLMGLIVGLWCRCGAECGVMGPECGDMG